MYPELPESVRFPRLTPQGRALLYRMRQHSHAPLWNWPNGEQLDDEGLARVQKFSRELNAPSRIVSMDKPDWLDGYVEKCLTEVPFYRSLSRVGTTFESLPTCDRSDLAPKVWAFVPDSEPLDSLVVFSSSGTTGHPTKTPHHPFSAACGVPLMEFALKEFCGQGFLYGSDHVAITNVAAYPGAFTTAIVVSYLNEAGCVRVNLDPSAWRNEGDRERYIDEWKAPVWLGDPVAFGAMEKLDLKHPPQAILSSILQLNDSYREKLSARYGCPVLDMYAMTEAGIIAVGAGSGHRVLAHDLYVEILDDRGEPCELGERGEITLTGGRNPFLPLLRYRTGDFASLAIVDGFRTLIGLEGRMPVEYRASWGAVVHSMQLTRLMRQHPVVRYEMLGTEGDYQLRIWGDCDRAMLQKDIVALLGNCVAIQYQN